MTKPKPTNKTPPGYPVGPQTVIFADMDEDTWWHLLHALEVRIRFFQNQRAALQRLDDPGLQRQIEQYDECIATVEDLLVSAQQQLSPSFFTRRAAESA